jgi:hypothetical protein
VSKSGEQGASDYQSLIAIFRHPERTVVRRGDRRDWTGLFHCEESWRPAQGRNLEQATDLSADDAIGHDEG